MAAEELFKLPLDRAVSLRSLDQGGAAVASLERSRAEISAPLNEGASEQRQVSPME